MWHNVFIFVKKKTKKVFLLLRLQHKFSFFCLCTLFDLWLHVAHKLEHYAHTKVLWTWVSIVFLFPWELKILPRSRAILIKQLLAHFSLMMMDGWQSLCEDRKTTSFDQIDWKITKHNYDLCAHRRASSKARLIIWARLFTHHLCRFGFIIFMCEIFTSSF